MTDPLEEVPLNHNELMEPRINWSDPKFYTAQQYRVLEALFQFEDNLSDGFGYYNGHTTRRKIECMRVMLRELCHAAIP